MEFHTIEPSTFDWNGCPPVTSISVTDPGRIRADRIIFWCTSKANNSTLTGRVHGRHIKKAKKYHSVTVSPAYVDAQIYQNKRCTSILF